MQDFTEDVSQGFVAFWDYDAEPRSSMPGAAWVRVVNIASHATTSTCANYSGGRRLPHEGLVAQWLQWAEKFADQGAGYRLWRLAVVKLIEDRPEGLNREDVDLTDEQLDLLKRIADHQDAQEIMAREGFV